MIDSANLLTDLSNILLCFVGGYGGSSGVGGGGGGGSGNDMITQEDTIFVAGMDPSTTEQDIETHFGAIGIIKVSCSTSKKCFECKNWGNSNRRECSLMFSVAYFAALYAHYANFLNILCVYKPIVTKFIEII